MCTIPHMRLIIFLPIVVLLCWTTEVSGEEASEGEASSQGEDENFEALLDDVADEEDEDELIENLAIEDRQLRVVVLEVEFSEGLAEPLQERLQENLVEALSRQDLDVIEPQTVEDALRPLGRSMSESCRAGRCVGWILEFLDGDAGLVAHIDAFESSYSVTLTLLGPYGDELGRAERRCDICTFDELADSVAIAGGQLSNQIPRRVHVGRIGIFPTPESARISVDGVAMGRGFLSLTLPIGLHIVEARLGGYQLLRREIMLHADDMLTLELELEPGGAVQVEEEEPDVIGPVLWSTATVGLITVLTGIIMMGIHGSCRDGPDSSCTNAFAAGVGLLSGGIGMGAISGVALSLISATQDR